MKPALPSLISCRMRQRPDPDLRPIPLLRRCLLIREAPARRAGDPAARNKTTEFFDV